MNADERALIENFFRRWSTMDVTSNNRSLFDEHLVSVRVLASQEGARILEGLDMSTPRAEFVRRFLALRDGKRQP